MPKQQPFSLFIDQNGNQMNDTEKMAVARLLLALADAPPAVPRGIGAKPRVSHPQPLQTTVLAWHLCADKLRDGRPIPPDGETLAYHGELVMCEAGLHASERIIDALQYAPGGTICRVECGGKIVRGPDKLICTQRTVLWRVDGAAPLREFVRACARDVLDLWEAPDVVKQYLETGDEKLRAAAREAAWAARAAAKEAGREAACEAAREAAWAANETAWVAASDAAWAAASEAQNARLEAMVNAAHLRALASRRFASVSSVRTSNVNRHFS